MLEITIPATDYWDERSQTFISTNEQSLCLEHSLDSISKWESKWCKPFLSTNMTTEETLDYIRCMTLTRNVSPNVYIFIPDSVIKQVSEYINSPMTATWFSEDKNGKKPGREVITAELIYYWMIALNIPFECRKWHLNRLLTLIRVCNIKNEPPKKMGKRATMSRNAAINAARRQQFNTKG